MLPVCVCAAHSTVCADRDVGPTAATIAVLVRDSYNTPTSLVALQGVPYRATAADAE